MWNRSRLLLVVCLMLFLLHIAVDRYFVPFRAANDAIQFLGRAENSAEERVAFERIAAAGLTNFSFQALDRQGARVDRAGKSCWEKVAVLRMTLDKTNVDHQVLDGDNIHILMRE